MQALQNLRDHIRQILTSNSAIKIVPAPRYGMARTGRRSAAPIADADGLLNGFSGKLPYGVRTSSASGTAMVNDAGVLDNYPIDLLTPGCTL